MSKLSITKTPPTSKYNNPLLHFWAPITSYRLYLGPATPLRNASPDATSIWGATPQDHSPPVPSRYVLSIANNLIATVLKLLVSHFTIQLHNLLVNHSLPDRLFNHFTKLNNTFTSYQHPKCPLLNTL